MPARVFGPIAWVSRACAICGRRANLGRTIPLSFVVGILLTLINQLDVFLQGEETTLTWVKVGLNFVVPFCVSNLGVLAGTRAADATRSDGFVKSRRRARIGDSEPPTPSSPPL